jgi:hypothetical protein
MRDTHCVFFQGRCEDVCCNNCPNKPAFTYSSAKAMNKVFADAAETGMGLSVTRIDMSDVLCAPDAVSHPSHYSRWAMEPVEFIAINNLPWWLANVIKYTMRFDAKDGLKDLYKGRSYLDMKIRQVEGHERFWEKPVAEERKLNENSVSATS